MAFEMFSAAHFAGLAALMLVIAAIVYFRARLREAALSRMMRVGMAILLLCCELSLQLSYIVQHNWWIGSLPFQLCSLMVLISAVVLIMNDKRYYDVIFFLGSMGALQALLTPNLDETFPNFRYFEFFIAHIGIVAAAVYMLAVERYRPTFGSVLRAMLWLHLLAIPAAVTNMATGRTNFMFLARKPETASLLDLLAPWPWYLLQLELVAFGLFLLLYGASWLLHIGESAKGT